MIIPLYGIISHTRSMTQSRIRGILAGFNRGIKRPINLSAFTAHIRLNMDGLKYLVFHPSRVSPCLGSWAFQLGHFLAEMDSWLNILQALHPGHLFQLGHFLAEMDRMRCCIGRLFVGWIRVSIGPLLSRNG